jgi:hypothetical protein
MIEPGGFGTASIFVLAMARIGGNHGIFATFLIPELLCDVIAAQPRKAKVKQNELRPVNACDLKGFGTAMGSPHLVTRHRDQHHHALHHVDVVIHDEDMNVPLCFIWLLGHQHGRIRSLRRGEADREFTPLAQPLAGRGDLSVMGVRQSLEQKVGLSSAGSAFREKSDKDR